VAVHTLIIAGWTGRDRAAVEKHIIELEAVGVPRPASVPVYYRVSPSRLTAAAAIQVAGDHSSGEAEFVLVRAGGTLWVGAGSDHTDRKVETYNITVSKQMCDKPVAADLWPFEEVQDHWDRLLLRSWAIFKDKRDLYQEGAVSALLPPLDLAADRMNDGAVMFGGTLPAIGGIRPAERFEFELEDPVKRRSIRHGYDVQMLPMAG
jgi:hypothetical protein